MTTLRKPRKQSPKRDDDTRWLNQMIERNETARKERSMQIRAREQQARARVLAELASYCERLRS